MQYELCYTNVLNMLELGRVPLTTDARTGSDPVVLAGGSITLAMEPMALFLDAILVGDAEDVLDAMVDTIITWKRSRKIRSELHHSLATIPGVYVPSLFEVSYKDDGTIEQIRSKNSAPSFVHKAIASNFEAAPAPTKPVVPNVEIIHDRMNIEIMRGCPHHCRFCQAVRRYQPLNLRSVNKIIDLCEETFRNTGYDEINLTSLSSADYPGIGNLIAKVAERFHSRRVNVALPSLRVSKELEMIPALTSTIRKAGLTLAPEAATDRLRALIKKPVANADLLKACRAAFSVGYRLLKFYFMIGIPNETNEDLRAIVDLSKQASLMRKEVANRRGAINVSVSSLVPKPHTPFQWEAMNTRDELRAKQTFILSQKRSPSLHFKFHDADESYLEAVFARGDRRLAAALLEAHKRGIRMDAWSECFNIGAWEEAFQDAGLDPDFYALRRRSVHETLPWDMIETHTPKSYLLREKTQFDGQM
jgi:radical SAM family uncharacterized protein